MICKECGVEEGHGDCSRCNRIIGQWNRRANHCTLNPLVRFRVKHKRVLTCYGLACEAMCKNPWIVGINSFRRTAWYWKDVTCKNCLDMRKKSNSELDSSRPPKAGGEMSIAQQGGKVGV